VSKHALLIEALGEQPAARWRVRVIRAGVSGNGNLYPPAVLREAAPLFDGARVFVKSDEDHIAGRGKDVRNLIGRLVGSRFLESDGGEVQAVLEMIEPAGPIATKLREAWSRKMTDLFGLSVDVTGHAEQARAAGRSVRRATRILKVNSVDLIVEPAAGGAIVNLVEAAKGSTMDEAMLTPEAIELALIKAELPQPVREKLLALIKTMGAKMTEAQLTEAIAAERQALARLSESGKGHGRGGDGRVELLESQGDKARARLDAFFDPTHKDHRHAQSIRDIYRDITGDVRFTGLIANTDRARMVEALGSASFANVLGDSVTRKLLADYRRPNQYDVWRLVATIVPVQDFRVQHRTRFGGYGDLPTVAERQPYPALTSPTDEEATYSVAKRGGTEDLSLEMITNDDVGAVRRIPQNLARAAKRSLSKFVMDMIRTNPMIYDSVALFHNDHANLGSAALDGTSFAAGRLAMMKQTEANSADRLGVGPASVLVPIELEAAARDLFARSTNNDKTFIQSLVPQVAPVWYWTDANDWALAADPLDVPGIEVGFLGGNEEPELFVQDSPTVGSLFNNDVITYKIRFIFGGNVVNYRAFYKGVVA